MFGEIMASQFVRDVTLPMSGQGGVQLITILTVSVISRLFRPEDFEVIALGTILAVPATLEYALAILLPDNSCTALKFLSLPSLMIVLTRMAILLLRGFISFD